VGSPLATSAPNLGSPLPHLHRDWAHRCHIGTGTGLSAATSAPGLGSPLPHLHRDWAHPPPHLHRDWAHRCHIGTGTRLTAATSAPGLGSPLPHLHRDQAHRCHIGTGTRLTAATSAPGLGSPLPHRHRDRAHRCHIGTGTGLAPATSAPGPGSPAATSAPGPGSPATTQMAAAGQGDRRAHLLPHRAHALGPCRQLRRRLGCGRALRGGEYEHSTDQGVRQGQPGGAAALPGYSTGDACNASIRPHASAHCNGCFNVRCTRVRTYPHMYAPLLHPATCRPSYFGQALGAHAYLARTAGCAAARCVRHYGPQRDPPMHAACCLFHRCRARRVLGVACPGAVRVARGGACCAVLPRGVRALGLRSGVQAR
jgi:hypothetical protein